MVYDQRVTGLDELIRTFEAFPDEVMDRGEKIVGQGCNNIRNDARKRLRAGKHGHLPHLPKSFDYDVTRRSSTIVGEAGANRAKPQGKLDPFIEYGTPTSAPHPHWGPALDAERPKFEKFAGELIAEALE